MASAADPAASLVAALELLTPTLSEGASIVRRGEEAYAAKTARWSAQGAPQPGAVVNVGTEADVEAVIRWATTHGVPFVAQSGGHAWADWFRLGSEGIVINLRALNGVVVDADRGVAVIQGGATVGEVMNAAGAAGVHVMIGSCNSVGAISSICGGGIGFLMGHYGAAADNIVSARLVGPSGAAAAVSAADADLFWAVRGAAHNFGVVTELTVRVHPALHGGRHYSGLLVFAPSQLEAVAEAAAALEVAPDMGLNLLLLRAPPTLDPVVAAAVWHPGDEAGARKAYAPLFALGPVAVVGEELEYAHLNDGLDRLCFTGGNKVGFSVSTNHLDPAALRGAWHDWEAWSARPGAELSLVNVEIYSTGTARSAAAEDSAVGPAVRGYRFHSFLCAMYTDDGLAGEARDLGGRFRRAMRGDDEGAPVYVNFATGDETVEQLYGSGPQLERLRALKRRYDPDGWFSRFIPIS